MKYQVIKSFIDVGNVTRNIGDIINIDGHRAGKLLQYRLIGLVKETAVKVLEVEKAVVNIKELAEIYPESKVYSEKLAEEKSDKPKKRR